MGSNLPKTGVLLRCLAALCATAIGAPGATTPGAAPLASEPHWAFRLLSHPAPPEVTRGDWPRNKLDRFVLGSLERAGLAPAPEADRRTWLRRVTLDLTGLPPAPDEIASFLADPRADAHEQVVERLLASPRYGERWAQHWLDVVRYADTHGFEVNTERTNAWPYRDYVIQAFNRDLPYDRFIREQIAGDLVGEDAATGFLVTASVLLPGQIGADEPSKRLARQDALDEIVVNLGQTFLALSVGCARCHDHKSDPIAQRDYYAMQAFVAGVEYEERELRPPGAGQRAFAGAFRKPDLIRVLRRGNPELPGDETAPAIPVALGALRLSADAPEAERRRVLADWIADPGHPLTARVVANRIWQGHFGLGLVDTPNDFGRGGSRPSNPPLLDWLAGEFIRGGWSIKHLHRVIVLSATYRQSSRLDAVAAGRDAEVRLLWRYPARRLEAEAIRDSVLAASGRLNLAMFGRGFDLFDKRGGLTGFQPVESYPDEGRRRMVYAHKVRREREAVFGAFDCPDAGQSTARRRESTTPLQALNLFNSRFVLEEADAFARRIRTEVGDAVPDQVRRAYALTLGRSPTADELADAAAVVRDHGLAVLGRALFNCNEFLFLP